MKKKPDELSCLTHSHECSDECHSCTNNFNPILAGIDLQDRKLLDDSRNKIVYQSGDVIYRENTYPSGLFCLNKGKVMVTKSDSNGNSIVTNLHKEVTFLGITDYLSRFPYQSTCIALSEVKVCLIKSDAIENLISTNVAFTKKLLNAIAIQYHQANARHLAITKKNMSARIADALIELLDVYGTDRNGDIDVYLRRSDIAQISNMSETNVIRQLSALNKSGIIKFLNTFKQKSIRHQKY